MPLLLLWPKLATNMLEFTLNYHKLNCCIVSDKEERFQFTWAAKAPIRATLRPCREESVDFDNTVLHSIYVYRYYHTEEPNNDSHYIVN
ncbi:MAG: hypothetical protein FWG02_06860 [Holophagaceae bacterium]|nr:hypothetical protein [Holophagaceae bacterium]